MKPKRRITKLVLLVTIAIFAGTFVLDGNPVLDRFFPPSIFCTSPTLVCEWF